eukprot:Sdes_comp13559_c0_seq2m3236
MPVMNSKPPDRDFGSPSAKPFCSGGNVRKSSQSHVAPRKKLIINHFKKAPCLPENYEEETWNILKAAIHAVHNKSTVSNPLCELYSFVENLCSYKMGPCLYSRLKTEMTNHVHVIYKRLSSVCADNISFLSVMDSTWENFCQQTILIRSIFLHLDRTYILQTNGVLSIWDMAVELYRDIIIGLSEIEARVSQAILELIASERSGCLIDRRLLKNVIRMLISLRCYESVFEEKFIVSTQDFYLREGEKYISELLIPSYLHHCSTRLSEEEDRLTNYLNVSTKQRLIAALETGLLRKHRLHILERGFDDIVDSRRYDQITLLYQLFERIDASDEIRNFFFMYIKKRGAALVTNSQKDKTMVQELLELKEFVDSIISTSFANNEKYVHVPFTHITTSRFISPHVHIY